MAENYLLQYKTFDELMSEVQMDFKSYDLNSFIETQTLIKVALRVNYELGLKIQKEKNIVLYVENGRVKLPLDFQILNYMYSLSHHKVISSPIQGTHVEEVPVAPTYDPEVNTIAVCTSPVGNTPNSICNTCQSVTPCGCSSITSNCDTWINCKGTEMQLIQKLKFETRQWTEFYRIRLTGDSKLIDPMCPNSTWMAKNTARIQEGYLYTSFQTGTLYLNYQGMMEDDKGNLLVLDHPMINDYYEYALKERCIENLLAANESINPGFIQRIDAKLKISRSNAISIVRTPDFSEIKNIWQLNRKAQFHKYYSMFVS